MKTKNITVLTAISFAAALTLAACGGDGGGGGNGGSSSNNSTSGSGSSSSGTTPASPTTGNVSTPQYAATSAQQAIFDQINTQRQACGFPALTENTVLDQAAQAHADYIGKNGGTITDDEVSGNPGYTGVTYTDRAAHFGYPTNASYATGESAGYYTNATLSEATYGANIATAWSSGVYHVAAYVWPTTQIGIGWNETTYNGFPEAHAVIQIANLQTMSGSVPLMYPCEGATGVPYKVVGETPTPPNTSGAWGPAVALGANQSDTIVLTSATLTDTSGNVINLQLLDSAKDTNKVLPAFEGVAYPAAPLSPNTKYSAVVSGTINGTPFTRTRTFTTGS